jgi:hypothetical protein
MTGDYCVHELRDDPAEDRGACVNVNHRCRLCGEVLSVTSYTPEAWAAKVAKDGPSELQGSLFATAEADR